MPFPSSFDSASAQRVRAVYSSWRGQPGWIHRIVVGVLLVILIGLAALLFLWGLAVAAVVIAISAVIVGIRAVARSFSGENTMRKNVRIVRRP